MFLDHQSRHIINLKETAPEALDYLEKVAVDTQVSLHINELLTRGSGVVFKGQRYSSGDVVVLGFCNDDYLFGLMKCVIACWGKTYFACTRLITEYFNSHFNSYKVHEADFFTLHTIDQLLDYHPLGLYQIFENNFVCLRHFVSIVVVDKCTYVFSMYHSTIIS